MAPHWSKEERAYFEKEVLPKSKYATGQVSEQGLTFKVLAQQMQTDLDALGQSRRVYSQDSLFQHWYQNVRVGVTSRRGHDGYYAPSKPGQGRASNRGQEHFGIGGMEDAAWANSLLPEETFTGVSPSSPAGGVSLSESLPVHPNSMLHPTYNVMGGSSSTELPPLPPSAYLTSSSTQTIAITSKNTGSSAMTSSLDLSAVIGVADQTLLDHGHPVSLGEATDDDQKRSAGEDDHGDTTTQTMVDLHGDNDSSNYDRKRNADDNDLGSTSTQIARKKSKTKAADLKYIVPDSVAELKPGSDPVSPSPAGKKTRARPTKASVPRKKKKAVDDGDNASSPLDDKKPMTAAARKKAASKSANKSTPISIPSGSDDMITEEDILGMTEGHMLKNGVGTYASGGTKDSKGQMRRGARGGRGQGQARGGGHQRARHQPVSSYSDDDDYGDSEDMEPPHSRQQPRQYNEYEYGGMGDDRYYGPHSPYYAPPPVYRGGYGGPQPGFRPNVPYNPHSQYISPYVPQYDPRGMSSAPPQLSDVTRVGTSHLDLHPNMPLLPPFAAALPPSLATSSHQVDVPAITGHALHGLAAPHPTPSHQLNIPAMTDRPISSQSNRPTSVHGADQSIKDADASQRPQRPLGRIYIAGGHEIMTETCPCCRRGFE